jgi:hypothetical protein
MAMNIIVLLIGGRNAARHSCRFPRETSLAQTNYDASWRALKNGSGVEFSPWPGLDIQVTRIPLIEQVFQRERRQRIRVDLVAKIEMDEASDQSRSGRP